MKLSFELHIIAIKPKYKTKYYKKCVTQKTETKHKTLNTKHYYLKVLYLSLVRGQYLYSRAKRRCIAL